MQRATLALSKRISAFDRFIDDPSFRDIRQRREFLKPMPGYEQLVALAQRLGPTTDGMCLMPILTPEQEHHLFRRMNCLKFCVNRARRKRAWPGGGDPDSLAQMQAALKECRDLLVLCNLRLVMSFLNKKNRRWAHVEQLFSDGYTHLLRAVDRFDYRKGIKFATYATWVLINNFARADEVSRRKVSPALFADLPDVPVEHDFDTRVREDECRSLLANLLSPLDARTRRIILQSEGVEGVQHTYEELGVAHKISAGRVCQIKSKGIKLLREAARQRRPLLV
jgi:RNA polymerase sigma factor (sigma-70 family)